MKTNHLTIKQEAFCQAYIRTGDKSAAYREAYSSERMKPESIHVRACKLSNETKISTRIAELRAEIIERNKITIDELVSEMAGMVRFDIADIYDENGNLKSIHDIPRHARMSIAGIETLEEFGFSEGERILVGHTKKIKLLSKLDAVEKLMKHLGGYEKDNNQKANILIPEERTSRLEQLRAKLNKMK